MGSLEGALCFFFFFFLLTLAHSLAVSFFTEPLFLFSRKSKKGVDLDGGGFGAGREGWAWAGLLTRGLLAGKIVNGNGDCDGNDELILER